MSIGRVYTVAVASLFVLCTLGPLVIYFLQPVKEVSLLEKRKLAVFPELTWEYDSIREFPIKFTAYYQDHFGLRDFLVNVYDSSKLNVFETSPSSYVIKGIDGWYFFVAGDIANDYYGLKSADEQKLERNSQTLIDRRDWLDSMGIRYLFVAVPNKINIYPEMLPERLRTLGRRTFYEQLMSYRKNETDKNIVDIYTLLNKTKKDHDVYHHTDTHWNDEGALDAFNQIIKQLNPWFPGLQTIEIKDTVRKFKNFSGDLTKILHQSAEISEQNVEIQLKSPCSNEKNDTQLAGLLVYKIKDLDPENKTLPVENGCNNKKLTVLLIHDSFGSYLRPYFNERFYRVIYSREYGFRKLKDLIASLKPDIVIEERVTRDMYKTLVKDIKLEEKVVEYQMSKTGMKTVFGITGDEKGDSIQSEYNALISKNENGYLINATTADPQLFFQFKLPNMDKRYNFMVELTVPSDTQMQLFYMPMGSSTYNAEFSVLRKVSKGYNKLFFHIPGPAIKGDIRLDPGGVAGSYVLHALAIKER